MSGVYDTLILCEALTDTKQQLTWQEFDEIMKVCYIQS